MVIILKSEIPSAASLRLGYQPISMETRGKLNSPVSVFPWELPFTVTK